VPELVDWGIDSGMFGPGWLPTIEGRGGVLPDFPERLIAEADTFPPLIIGTNKREWGLYQALGASMPATRGDFERTLERQFGSEASSVKAEYPIQSDADVVDTYIELVSDVSYRCPARSIALLASGRDAQVWMYSFEEGAAFHSHELDYVFGGDAFSAFGGSEPNSVLQAQVQRYWTRFALDGDPNGDDDAFWPRYDVNDDHYLVLADPPSANDGLARSRCEFWRDYILKGGTISLD
jgi:para-nitrobenzyl esterase